MLSALPKTAKSFDQTAVVVLDFNRGGRGFREYLSLPVPDKIALIVKSIRKICLELEKKAPYAKWIFVWRDYGIEGPKVITITEEDKNQLKKAMLTLQSQYSNMEIIAGTVSLSKKTPVSEINSIAERYAAVAKSNDTLKLMQESKDFYKNWEKIEQIKKNPTVKYINIVRNRCYIFPCTDEFPKGTVFHINKTLCLGDIDEDNTEIPEIFKMGFRPGRNIVGNNVIEICLDHRVGVAKDDLQRHFKPEERPQLSLHFVLSDSTYVKMQNVIAEKVVHVDSYQRPCLVANGKEVKENVQLYVHPIVDNYFFFFSMLQEVPLIYSFAQFLLKEMHCYFDAMSNLALKALLNKEHQDFFAQRTITFDPEGNSLLQNKMCEKLSALLGLCFNHAKDDKIVQNKIEEWTQLLSVNCKVELKRLENDNVYGGNRRFFKLPNSTPLESKQEKTPRCSV